jgi:hypothetical protein
MAIDILPSEKPIFSANSVVATDYTFDASTKTLTINEAGLKRVLYVFNSTYGELLYNPYNKELGGTMSGTTLTLDYPTNTFMSDSDNLLIVYEKHSGNAPAISLGNSTTTNLGAGNSYTFTGTWERNFESDVMVNFYSDQNCTLLLQFSNDGVTTHSQLTKETTANINEFTTAVKGARYFRVVISSDSLTTTTLNLQVQYGVFRQGNAPLNLPLGLDADAILTRSTFTWLDVARGLSSGIVSVKKFGRNKAVGTTFTPIALGGVYNTPQVSGATTLRVKAGGNANDTAAGSGAREVTLIGLDENFEEITIPVATNGASASSATTETFTRLYRAFVSKSGTYATPTAGSHAGEIVIENGAGGTDWLTIDATGFPKGQSEVGAFTIPANTTGYVKLRDLSIDSGKTIDMVFFAREGVDETAAPFSPMRAQSVISGVTGGSVETFGSVEIPFGPYNGPTDMGFMARVSSGTASVSIEFEIFIISE